MNKYIFLLSITLFMVACSSDRLASRPSSREPTSLFTCSDGSMVRVRYLQAVGMVSTIELELGGQASGTLSALPVASGAKYGDESMSWWEKGDSGFVQRNGVMYKRDCIRASDQAASTNGTRQATPGLSSRLPNTDSTIGKAQQ